MHVLYVVATPIGNLEDITLRALRGPGRGGPNRRRGHPGHPKALGALRDTHPAHQLPRAQQAPEASVALGRPPTEGPGPRLLTPETPGVSDPGYELVRAASEAGVRVLSVPGPSAVTSAVAVSGLTANQFVYLGFLPRRRGERRRLLTSMAAEGRTMVALETPHRLQASLEDLQETLGDRRVAVVREQTKLHEEVFRGPLSECAAAVPGAQGRVHPGHRGSRGRRDPRIAPGGPGTAGRVQGSRPRRQGVGGPRNRRQRRLQARSLPPLASDRQARLNPIVIPFAESCSSGLCETRMTKPGFPRP